MNYITLLEERTFRFASPRRPDGTNGLLRVGVNTYNRVTLACQSGEAWINAEFPLTEWRMFLTKLRGLAVNGKPGDTFSIDCTKQDKGTKQQIVTGIVKCYRDDDGVVVIELAAPGMEPVGHKVIPAYQYRWTDNGQPMASSDLSRMKTVAWCEEVGAIAPHAIATNAKQFDGNTSKPAYTHQGAKKPWNGPKKPWNGNNGGGGNQNFQRPQQQQQAAPQANGNFDQYVDL